MTERSRQSTSEIKLIILIFFMVNEIISFLGIGGGGGGSGRK